MSKTTQEPTLQDVSNKVDIIIDTVNTAFTAVTVEMQAIKDTMVTKEDLKKELVKVVTKEYLDEKLSDLQGNLTVIIRKEDRKVVALIDELRQTKVLSEQAAQRILGLEPFPQS